MANILSTRGPQTRHDEACEHVEAGEPVAAVLCEDDSFGPVARFGVCAACLRRHNEEEAERLVTCYDCGQAKPAREVRMWKWYDFYAAQGDKPLPVCRECLKGPAHRARVAQDREDLEWEEAQRFGGYGYGY